MPDLDDTQASDQDQQLSLTGDDLAALHGVARQLQAAGDPRAQKLWSFIGAYSGDGSAKPAYTLRQSPLKTTNWQDDLETELWGDAAGDDQPAATTNSIVDDEDDAKPAADGTGATADFLDDLSGIGLHAYLAMRDPDLPAFKDWRNGYFTRQGSNYVSREGEAYTNDELKQAHQVLSHQAGNPLISNMFIGPKFQTADYLVWRNQNFSDDGGPWQDDEGNIYSEPALQEMFGDKFATRSNDASAQVGNETAGLSQESRQADNKGRAVGSEACKRLLTQLQSNRRRQGLCAKAPSRMSKLLIRPSLSGNRKRTTRELKFLRLTRWATADHRSAIRQSALTDEFTLLARAEHGMTR